MKSMTHSGRWFDPVSPTQESILIEDIAHALSHLNRFCGHTIQPYSVAQHSVEVAMLLSQRGFDGPIILQGLMHDAAEAYCGDLITPIKIHVCEFKVIERGIWKAIAAKFGIPEECDPVVGKADLDMACAEYRDLMSPLCPGWKEWAPNTVDEGEISLVREVRPWNPGHAKHNFLSLFNHLSE